MRWGTPPAAKAAPEAPPPVPPAAVPAVPPVPPKLREEKPAAKAVAERPAAVIDRVAAELRAKLPEARLGRKGEILDLTFPSDLAFDPGKAQVRPGARRSLAALAEILKRYPGTLATIEGHTDALGTAGSNQALSEGRARAVFDVLRREGVDALRLTIRAYGERVPVADNSTPEGRRANRRVQIKIRPDGSHEAPAGKGGQG